MPTIMPLLVWVERAVPAVSLASPKSNTFAAPVSVITTLAGFRSRWTIPAACAQASASAI